MRATPKPSSASLLQRLRADLRGDPRKRMALFVLLPVLIVVWVPVLRGGSDRGVATRPAPLQQGTQAEEQVGYSGFVDGQLRDRMASLVQRVEQPYVPSWNAEGGAQAFVSTIADERPAIVGRSDPTRLADAEREQAQRLVTSATIVSATRGGVAVIDGVAYRQGATVGDFVIEDIGTREVVVRGRYGRYELRIRRQGEERP